MLSISNLSIGTYSGTPGANSEGEGDTLTRTYIYMKATPNSTVDQEPIGIVISRGSRYEPAPMVSAYVWGPVPETKDERHEAKVA